MVGWAGQTKRCLTSVCTDIEAYIAQSVSRWTFASSGWGSILTAVKKLSENLNVTLRAIN